MITKIGLEKEGGESDNVERKAMVLRMVLVCVWEVWRGRNPVMKHSGIMYVGARPPVSRCPTDVSYMQPPQSAHHYFQHQRSESLPSPLLSHTHTHTHTHTSIPPPPSPLSLSPFQLLLLSYRLEHTFVGLSPSLVLQCRLVRASAHAMSLLLASYLDFDTEHRYGTVRSPAVETPYLSPSSWFCVQL